MQLPGVNRCIVPRNMKDAPTLTSQLSSFHWTRGLPACQYMQSHVVQVKWVKDAKSSAYAIVQETVKGVTKRQITGMNSQHLFL